MIYQARFNAGGCEVSVPVSAETEAKARQIAMALCIQSGGNPKTVKIN